MPPSYFEHTTHVDRSADEIWQRLQRGETWESIGPVEKVWDAVHDDKGSLEAFTWSTTVAGRSYRGTAATQQAVPGSLIEFRISTSEVKGTLAAAISPNGSGADLTVSLSMTATGTLASLFFGLVKEAVRRGLPVQVEAFGASFED